MSTFPSPVVNAHLFGRYRSRKLGGSDETQNGITTPTQALLAADLCSCLPSYGLSQLAQRFLQAFRPLSMRTTQLWKLFCKNLSWTTTLRTKEATDLNEESDCTPGFLEDRAMSGYSGFAPVRRVSHKWDNKLLGRPYAG
jgi:hypothetical protein